MRGGTPAAVCGCGKSISGVRAGAHQLADALAPSLQSNRAKGTHAVLRAAVGRGGLRAYLSGWRPN